MEVHDFLDSTEVSRVGEAGDQAVSAGVQQMARELQLEQHRYLNLTPDETCPYTLRRFFVKSGGYSVPDALALYLQWVAWRRENNADTLPRESIQRYIDRREAVWTGRSRNGMRCCFVTGRRHEPLASTGQTFRQYMLHVVEEGCLRNKVSGAATETETEITLDDTDGEPTHAAGAEIPAPEGSDNSENTDSSSRDSNNNTDKVCVVYDRRGLQYSHIDPVAFQASTSLVGELQQFYGDCVGAIYIVHVNLLFWAAYTILRPLLQLINGDRLVILSEARDILQYVDESELPEGFLDDAQEEHM